MNTKSKRAAAKNVLALVSVNMESRQTHVKTVEAPVRVDTSIGRVAAKTVVVLASVNTGSRGTDAENVVAPVSVYMEDSRASV